MSNNNTIKRLDVEVRVNAHIYKLWRRSDKVALYKQYDKDGDLVGYEVFKILTRPEETIKSVVYPHRETFCANEQFGVSAWSPPMSRGENYALKMFEDYDKELNEKLL